MPRYFENTLLPLTGRTRMPLPSLSNKSLSPLRTPSTRRISRGTVICPLLVILACFCIVPPPRSYSLLYHIVLTSARFRREEVTRGPAERLIGRKSTTLRAKFRGSFSSRTLPRHKQNLSGITTPFGSPQVLGDNPHPRSCSALRTRTRVSSSVRPGLPQVPPPCQAKPRLSYIVPSRIRLCPG
jgi:hypothetical protein